MKINLNLLVICLILISISISGCTTKNVSIENQTVNESQTPNSVSIITQTTISTPTPTPQKTLGGQGIVGVWYQIEGNETTSDTIEFKGDHSVVMDGSPCPMSSDSPDGEWCSQCTLKSCQVNSKQWNRLSDGSYEIKISYVAQMICKPRSECVSIHSVDNKVKLPPTRTLTQEGSERSTFRYNQTTGQLEGLFYNYIQK